MFHTTNTVWTFFKILKALEISPMQILWEIAKITNISNISPAFDLFCLSLWLHSFRSSQFIFLFHFHGDKLFTERRVNKQGEWSFFCCCPENISNKLKFISHLLVQEKYFFRSRENMETKKRCFDVWKRLCDDVFVGYKRYVLSESSVISLWIMAQ